MARKNTDNATDAPPVDPGAESPEANKKNRQTRSDLGLGILLIPKTLADRVDAAAKHYGLKSADIGNEFAPDIAKLFGFGGAALQDQADGQTIPGIKARFEKLLQKDDLFAPIELTPTPAASVEHHDEPAVA